MSAGFDAYYWPEFKDRLLDAIPGDASEQTIREHRRLWMGDDFNPTALPLDMEAEIEKNIKLGRERRPNEQGAPTLPDDTSGTTLPTTTPTPQAPFSWGDATIPDMWNRWAQPAISEMFTAEGLRKLYRMLGRRYRWLGPIDKSKI